MAGNAKQERGPAAARYDPRRLRELAGDKVLARGRSYAAAGHVEILVLDDRRVSARVAGSEIYKAELIGSGPNFAGSCSCPAFSDMGMFCKHLVAVALTVDASAEQAAPVNRFAQVRAHLRETDQGTLIDLLMAEAEQNPALFERLEIMATLASGDDALVAARVKDALTKATRVPRYIEYGRMREWATGVQAALGLVGALIARGKAALALPLLGHFFSRMTKAAEGIDDSDGDAGALMTEGASLYREALSGAPPDPVALARELFHRETEWESDCFADASDTYAGLLGTSGLAEYRRLADKAWADIKPLRGGARTVIDDQFTKRFRLASILEGLALRDNDIDRVIAIRSRDLSSAYAYLRIAEFCLEHGREAEARRWAEDGLWQFESRPDKRLVAFAARLGVVPAPQQQTKPAKASPSVRRRR